MSDIEILEKLGMIIHNYFKYITPQDENYYLLVDEFLFESFLNKMQKQYNLSLNRIYQAYNNIKCNVLGNPYAALAIAAYQVMIFYTLESNCDSDAYNEKLFSSVAYRGLTYSDYWYQDTAPKAPSEGKAYQEDLWKIVAKTFNISNIPEHTEFGAHDRYVQYPASQNLLGSSMRTFRIRYADRFIELGLEPNQGITFEVFEGLVFNRDQYNYIHNPMLRRLVFSFYCMWDGRSYREIYERRRAVTLEESESRAREEFCIQLEPEIKFYINRTPINLTKDFIDDKYLWRFDESPYMTRRGVIFLKDSDYNDWLPSVITKAIDPNEEIMLLTTQKQFPTYIEKFLKSEEIEVLSAGMYKLLILNLKERDSFKNFMIPVKVEPSFFLIGGLKSKRNTYYSFALPRVKFSYNNDYKKYKSVYLDSKEILVENGVAILPDKLAPGRHCIKLLNSWDSSEVFFYVEKKIPSDIPNTHGWILDEPANELKPTNNMEETVIDGLTLVGNLEWIKRNTVVSRNQDNNELRPFLFQKERLENRFQLNRRCHYGN